jgi:hypothetical protein
VLLAGDAVLDGRHTVLVRILVVQIAVQSAQRVALPFIRRLRGGRRDGASLILRRDAVQGLLSQALLLLQDLDGFRRDQLVESQARSVQSRSIALCRGEVVEYGQLALGVRERDAIRDGEDGEGWVERHGGVLDGGEAGEDGAAVETIHVAARRGRQRRRETGVTAAATGGCIVDRDQLRPGADDDEVIDQPEQTT